VFPFHFALDRENRIAQVGPVLARTFSDVLLGTPFAELFRPKRPVFPDDHTELRARQGTLLLLEHRRTGIVLRGELADVGDVPIFLGSPWVTNIAMLWSLGLNLCAAARRVVPSDRAGDGG
jgi:hypothetical protein